MKTYLESSVFYEDEYLNLPIFDSNTGMDYEWYEDNNTKHCKVINDNKPRIVTLEITSWCGVSPDAIHVYGKLIVHDLYYSINGKSSCSSTNQPEITQGFEIEIRRKLTQEEIDSDPDRFAGWRAGNYITNFLTEKELIKVAKKIFKEKFVGNWKLKIKR
jgi:hypothetical protein